MSRTACTAVGGYENVSTETVGPTLAERWDGGRWSIQPTAEPPGATNIAFDDVSCTSYVVCTAVGGYDVSAVRHQRLAERWDGTAWSIQPVRNDPGSLLGVSCTSSTVCAAVGNDHEGGAGGSFAERWDGTAWSIQPIPKPAGALHDVSCISSVACAAVGYSPASAERWDGTAWSIQPIPKPRVTGAYSGLADTGLFGVSCTSSSACTAVGDYEYEKMDNNGSLVLVKSTLAERWNGRRWSIQRTANPPGSNEAGFRGVSCISSTACTAVGDYYASAKGIRVPLAERWNSRRWSIQPTPNHAGSHETILNGVSCSSSTACTAVGDYLGRSGISIPLVERLTPTTPATVKLTGIPRTCIQAPFTAHIRGIGIALVRWWVDGRRIPGRSVHRGTSYAVSVSLAPGRHQLTVRVTFVAGSHTRTFHSAVNGCPPPHAGFG